MANILFINANMGKSVMHKSGGGSMRTMALLEALSDHNVTFFSFGWEVVSKHEKINDNLTYVYPGVDARALQMKNRAFSSVSRNPDLCIDTLYKYLGQARNKLKQLLGGIDLVILEHYSGAPFLNEIEGIPIVYSSQNCEIFMANQLFGADSEAAKVTRRMESLAISKANAVLYCSDEDLNHLTEYYGIGCPAYYVPNGADKRTVTDATLRHKSKSVFFVGGGHPPNVTAVNAVVPVARLVSDITFNLAGNSSNGISIKKDLVPSNIKVLGQVTDAELEMMFRDSLAFINPMSTGSGTHLKMMEALSYGIPIVTSSIGARGFNQDEKDLAMLIADTPEEMSIAIDKLKDMTTYESLVEGSKKVFVAYDWVNVKHNFVENINSIIKETVIVPPEELEAKEKESVLIYSIVRNIGRRADKYYAQIRDIVDKSPDYDFYLSIYENDSTDNTKQALFSKDWSFLSGVSIIAENINTKFYGSVKDATRVENLAKARNKAIEAGGFLDKVDYILMIEGDNSFKTTSVRELLNFKNLEPDFDVVSSVSIRPTGSHYDWWATRTTAVFVTDRSELDPKYKEKDYGKYYSTSNGLCLYRAKPFQEGVRHGWINNVTNEFDCEMVVVCQNLRDAGYENVYINYKALSFH